MKTMQNLTAIAAVLLVTDRLLFAQEFQLLTGVDAGMTPGASRLVFPQTGFPAEFFDGDRLAGTAGVAPAPFLGDPLAPPVLSPNQFGSLSFMFRRGSIPAGGSNQVPILAIDYLGGPRLDLDGDLGNGSRSLVPVTGQTAVPIPGSRSFLDLTIDKAGSSITLNDFDATATNQGADGFSGNIAVTVNTIAGTLPNTANQTGPINPTIDTRTGSLTLLAPQVHQIGNLGYEVWQDSVDPTSSTADTLGTFQYLGAFRGWLIERDNNGNFPMLAGIGLGTTLWPAVDTSQIGNTFVQSSLLPALPISDGVAEDVFSAPNNGGIALTDFGGDLGAYLDSMVVPLVNPLSESFVYLESAGFGLNNSFDPLFGETNGYDVVLIAQSRPIPEPATISLVAILSVPLLWRRRRPMSE